jgi:hypothetical protein
VQPGDATAEQPSAGITRPVSSTWLEAHGRIDASRHAMWIAAGLLALLAIPLMVAVGVLHDPHWYPVGDLAQVELRVRDVGTRHPPLIGMVGRIGSLAVASQGVVYDGIVVKA